MVLSASPETTSSTNSDIDPRVQITFNSVNWDILSSYECKLHKVDKSQWGEQISGGYNLVRFLHLRDVPNTVLIARIPLRSEASISAESISPIQYRIASEVATMEYVEMNTNIPVPHVIHHDIHAGGDVGSPYILMSKVEGVQLSSVWDNLGDDKRRIVLKQVVNILLQLWSHRFDKKGVLFKKPGGGEGKEAWCIKSDSIYADPRDTGSWHSLVTTSYTNAVDYWLAYANAKLHDLCDENFGSGSKPYDYSQTWFLRSLIPALFDPSIDLHGYPLSPGDFHSQNIMITDVEKHPRITAVIDWEFSGPDFATSFAHYPLFIVDHPFWDEDHPLRKRNVNDQAVFNELIREAEEDIPPIGDTRLSDLIFNSYSIYIFQQVMQFPETYSSLYPILSTHIFGEDNDGIFLTEYYWALMEKGILKKDTERFEKEYKVLLEAREVLGDDKVPWNLKKTEFKDLVQEHRDSFGELGNVRQWLASNF